MSKDQLPILGYEGRADPERRRRRRAALLVELRDWLPGVGLVCVIFGGCMYDGAGTDLGQKLLGWAVLATGLVSLVAFMASTPASGK